MSVIRAAGLRGFVPLVDELGGDGVAILARCGIEPDAADSYDALVPVDTLSLALELAAAQVHRGDFGLLLTERQDASILGPLAVALANSATLGDALDCAARFLFVHSPALDLRVDPDPDGDPAVVALSFGRLDPGAPVWPQGIDMILGFTHRFIGQRSTRHSTSSREGAPYGLLSVDLPHPALAPVDRYTDFFGAPVRFDAGAARLRVPDRLRSAPLDGGDAVLRTMALDFLVATYGEVSHGLAHRVRTVVRQSLGSADVSLPSVGRMLLLHPRTLQRRLAEEGTTFDEIVDGVRRTRTLDLLTTTDLPLGQVSAMVGLAEQSALTRAVRRWFGRTPSAVRRDRTPVRR